MLSTLIINGSSVGTSRLGSMAWEGGKTVGGVFRSNLGSVISSAAGVSGFFSSATSGSVFAPGDLSASACATPEAAGGVFCRPVQPAMRNRNGRINVRRSRKADSVGVTDILLRVLVTIFSFEKFYIRARPRLVWPSLRGVLYAQLQSRRPAPLLRSRQQLSPNNL